MRRVLLGGLALAAAAAIGFWIVTEPERAAAEQVAGGAPDIENGRIVFFAGGCASCHATPGQDDKLLLGGGVEVESPAGAFFAPNISPHFERGIGSWTAEQFATAILKGVAPDGRHYYPAFPYTTYRHMKPTDVRDLLGFLRTLTPADNVSPGHAFPLEVPLVRQGVGLWKRFHLNGAPFARVAEEGAAWNRGRYLVDALGHCAECHSPRGLTGAIIEERRNGGARMPGGGTAPNITPGEGGIGDWTEEDIALFLADGTTPEGDVVSREMEDVIGNTSELSESDRRAMAVYLKSLKPVDD